MSNYRQLYRDGGVSHQTIANEIMSILDRIDALEGKLEPQRRDCVICGKWYEDNGTHVCAAKTAPAEQTSERLYVARTTLLDMTFGRTEYTPATYHQVRAEAARLGLLDITQERLDAYLLEHDMIIMSGETWRQLRSTMAKGEG